MLRVEIANKLILFTKVVIDIFCQQRQFKQSDEEKGGIVLGQVSKSEQEILVCRVSIPTNHDMSSKYSFHRSHEWAQQIIDYEFVNSGRKNTYLGEWHTHPSNRAVPSPQDIRMIKKQFAVNEIRTNFMLLLIAAQEELFIGLYDGEVMKSVRVKEYCTAINLNDNR